MSDEAEVHAVEAAPEKVSTAAHEVGPVPGDMFAIVAADAAAEPAPAHEVDPVPVDHVEADAAPEAPAAPGPTPAQIVASADAIYNAQLTKAAEPDPEAKKLRDMARQLWSQADAIDGPDRIAARQMLQQHNQTRQRQVQRRIAAPAPGAPAAKPPAG